MDAKRHHKIQENKANVLKLDTTALAILGLMGLSFTTFATLLTLKIISSILI